MKTDLASYISTPYTVKHGILFVGTTLELIKVMDLISHLNKNFLLGN